MKIKLFLMAALAGVALVGCNRTPEDNTADGDKSYMLVKLVAPGTATKGLEGDPNFDGIEAESKIDNIYFFFYVGNSFLCEGKAVNKTDFGFNDIPDPYAGYETDNTVEKKSSKAVIVLESNGTKPNGVLCFINLTDADRAAIRGKSLPEALAYTYEAKDGKSHIQFGYEKSSTYYFTMSNSVYLDGSDFVFAYEVKESNCKDTEAEAKADPNPVVLYMDRVASKVSDVTCPTTVPDLQDASAINTFQITLGDWGLNGVNRSAYFVKNVEDVAAWKASAPLWMHNTKFTGSAVAAIKRMFWEKDLNYKAADLGLDKYANDAVEYYDVDGATGMSPGVDGSSISGDFSTTISPLWYYSYNDIVANKDAATTDNVAIGSNFLLRNYCFPNTFSDTDGEADPSRYATDHFRRIGTHVLVLAQAKFNGTAQDFYEYGGMYYDEANYIAAALSNMQANLKLYYKDGTTWKQLDASKVEIAKAVLDETSTPKLIKRVVETAASDGYCSLFYTGDATTELYTLTGADPADDASYTVVSTDQINQVFSTDIICRANKYKDGYMYYCVPIEHLETDADKQFGTYGMVRNHDYRITVTGVKTLGKGIYDPDEKIVPGDKEKKWYLAAVININAWHVVTQTVELSE